MLAKFEGKLQENIDFLILFIEGIRLPRLRLWHQNFLSKEFLDSKDVKQFSHSRPDKNIWPN